VGKGKKWLAQKTQKPVPTQCQVSPPFLKKAKLSLKE